MRENSLFKSFTSCCRNTRGNQPVCQLGSDAEAAVMKLITPPKIAMNFSGGLVLYVRIGGGAVKFSGPHNPSPLLALPPHPSMLHAPTPTPSTAPHALLGCTTHPPHHRTTPALLTVRIATRGPCAVFGGLVGRSRIPGAVDKGTVARDSRGFSNVCLVCQTGDWHAKQVIYFPRTRLPRQTDISLHFDRSKSPL